MDTRKLMRLRLQRVGGEDQEQRMIADKLWSLKQALKSRAYQRAIVKVNESEYFCLINPNKETLERDDTIISIPYENENLVTGATEQLDLKEGSVVYWKQTNTYWIIYAQHLTEDAYFKAYMRQCSDDEVEVNSKKFRAYIKGPSEKTINWQKTKYTIYNELNYTLEMYIPNTAESNELFKRHQKVTYQGKPWEVQAVDRYTNKGILLVYLKEDYTNSMEAAQGDSHPETNPPITGNPQIIGDAQVYPYDIKEYQMINFDDAVNGRWELSNKRACIVDQTSANVKVEITTGRSGDVSLVYKSDNMQDIIFNISILSL